MLRRAERFTDLAEKVVTHLPKSKTMRDAVTRVDRDKARVDFVKRYSDLYGMYTETEVVYTDERVVALWSGLSDEDQARFPFDAGVLDWKHYLQDVHCPAVTQSLRELSRKDREKPRSRSGAPTSRPSRSSTWRERSSPRTSSSPTCGRASPIWRRTSGRPSS